MRENTEAEAQKSRKGCQKSAVVPCYGKEILEAVAKKQGIPVERSTSMKKKATGSLIYSMFVMSRVQTGDPNMLTEEGKVFLDEQLEIRRLAIEGPQSF